ncbi:hypothetical protein [Vibrio furnissii]|uniref:hypothetical protein n=1 Tax=Vibrio furnissii TaxID=29494 RepID=UPI001EEA6E4C|nr:hypothetical protein [Vibrio furnissii]
MSQGVKVRLACLCLFIAAFGLWAVCTYGVYGDYIDIINRADVVQVSILTLWVPVGGFGAIACIAMMLPKALYSGRKMNEIFTSRQFVLANKLCIWFALLGVAFAAGWTYHSIDLLGRYGYVYSRDLTLITPSGIHLHYIHAR